jgi:hypothetical protein
MKRLAYATAALALFAAPNLASATTSMSTQTDSIPLQSTNWADDLSIDLFDPSLGELCEVKITLQGDVEGTASYESLDAGPTTVNLDLQATIELFRPDNSSIVAVIPLANVSDNATAFDSIIDFDGSSGNTFSDLAGNAMDMVVLTDQSDLDLFTGLGSILLPVNATGQSNGSGAGNLITQFTTNASAGIEVKYTYKIPEPTSVVMLALGGLGLIGIRRRS